MAFAPGWGFGGTQPPQWANPGGQPQQQPQQPTSGFNPTQGQQPQQGYQPPLTSGPGGGMPQSGYGMQNPYHTDQFPVKAPPPAPTDQMRNDFIPPILGNPYTSAINNAQNQANWFGQATPAAAQFQNALYGGGISPMEQMYAGASAQIGSRELGQTHNRLANMFENNTMHGSLAPAFLDATNQFNMQMNQMMGQMGTQRQQMAANMLPFTAGFPIQAGQAGMQGAQGYYDMLQNMMYGDASFPLAMFGSNPVMMPSIIAS